MSDLRQGVTETQHAVLDLIEQRAADLAKGYPWQLKLSLAEKLAATAALSMDLQINRTKAVFAAALMIEAADEISRLISANPTGDAS